MRTRVADKSWIATQYAFISALIFYGCYLTAAILSGKAGALTPLCGLVSVVIYFVIYTLALGRWFEQK